VEEVFAKPDVCGIFGNKIPAVVAVVFWFFLMGLYFCFLCGLVGFVLVSFKFLRVCLWGVWGGCLFSLGLGVVVVWVVFCGIKILGVLQGANQRRGGLAAKLPGGWRACKTG